MNFLIDENIPRAADGLLTEFGHDVMSIELPPALGQARIAGDRLPPEAESRECR